ncbi:hypothetical protein T07_10451 [Trichinella nelsoni]|uniref:Uncharacterized protein n=1 Tax=Trichinella nelsoni TaxID=6336 RepID=A0A0V0RH08_9BILA|nr:hypothetical protein T07_10451 [Trichinella nelsoni]
MKKRVKPAVDVFPFSAYSLMSRAQGRRLHTVLEQRVAGLTSKLEAIGRNVEDLLITFSYLTPDPIDL